MMESFTGEPTSDEGNITSEEGTVSSEEGQVVSEAPADETPKEDDSSKKFQQLAEREREFRRQELDFKKQSEELSQRMAALEERESKINNPNHLVDILHGMGMTVEDFSTRLLTGQLQVEKPEVDPISQEQEALRKELQELQDFRKSVQQQQEQAELEQHLAAYRNEIRDTVPQYENLSEWFGDSLDEAVEEAEALAEAYAEQYDKAPEVKEILSQMDVAYGKKVERFKSKYSTKETPSEKKPAPKASGKSLSHNHTRSVAVDTKGDDVVSRVLKGNPRDVMQERALQIAKKHGQL